MNYFKKLRKTKEELTFFRSLHIKPTFYKDRLVNSPTPFLLRTNSYILRIRMTCPIHVSTLTSNYVSGQNPRVRHQVVRIFPRVSGRRLWCSCNPLRLEIFYFLLGKVSHWYYNMHDMIKDKVNDISRPPKYGWRYKQKIIVPKN